MIQVSIIIINYKTATLSVDCIKSIYKFEKNISFEIIVVDNNSEDNIEQLLLENFDSDINFIQMGYNSGFSRANNAGMKIAKGQKILLLNSDTYLFKPDTIKNSLAFLVTKTNKDVIAPVLLNEDLSYQCSARSWFFGMTELVYANPVFILLTRKFKHFHEERNKKDELLHKQESEVKWINGAFQLFDRSLIDEHKLFYDEDFFLYGEDVEWAYRLRLKGGAFYIFPKEKIIHLGSASSQNMNLYKIAQVELSNWLFIRKSYGAVYYCFYTLVDLLNISIDNLLSKTTDNEDSNKNIRDLKKYLYRKYFKSIIFYKQNKKEKTFKFNVYENDKEFIEKR